MSGLMTAEELAESLAVSPDTIREWTRKRLIPAVHISPKVVRYDWHTVLRELAKRQTGVGVSNE
jgi:excisionase family DNA binding protein